MELDFSKLKGIKGKALKFEEDGEAPRSPVEPRKEQGGIITPTSSTEAHTEPYRSPSKEAWDNDPNRRATSLLTGQQEAYNKYVEVCRYYQEATKRTEDIRAELRKRAKAGAGAYDLLMLALEGLELTTGDKTLAGQVMGWIQE